MENCNKKNPEFILLGASMNTGNLGVSALLASTVKCFLLAYPGATISRLEGSRLPTVEEVRMVDGRVVRLGCVGVRCNKTFWRANHVLRLLLTAMLLRLIPKRCWREKVRDRNPYLRAIGRAQLVGDITAGDSFSDIYGMRRLVFVSLPKILVLAAGADLVLLPQTYGPFKGFWGRVLARGIIRRAAAIYSRDQQGLEELARLMGRRRTRAKPQFCPDIAFVLDPIAPSEVRTLPSPLPQRAGKVLVGFNVSGLLYNGGYTRNNMFGLSVDYRQLVHSLIEGLLAQDDMDVLLVPHVFPPPELAVESDVDACHEVFDDFLDKFTGRIYCLEGEYDQNEIKHIIGQCDFFVGSRMHACIAAASQCVPAVPLAYSKKFKGVFDCVGAGDLVADLRCSSRDEILKRTRTHLARRLEVSRQLQGFMKTVHAQVDQAFALMTELPCRQEETS